MGHCTGTLAGLRPKQNLLSNRNKAQLTCSSTTTILRVENPFSKLTQVDIKSRSLPNFQTKKSIMAKKQGKVSRAILLELIRKCNFQDNPLKNLEGSKLPNSINMK